MKKTVCGLTAVLMLWDGVTGPSAPVRGSPVRIAKSRPAKRTGAPFSSAVVAIARPAAGFGHFIRR